jgi:hypothetical protein
VASSVQNLFPLVFGKTNRNVDTDEALPALPTPERWDSNDGNTGFHYHITGNMVDVKLQIQESINTILGDFPEAQYIARECLHSSKWFALELCQFITLDFQKWRHGRHAKWDTLKMTSVCVRRIFEELYSERVACKPFSRPATLLLHLPWLLLQDGDLQSLPIRPALSLVTTGQDGSRSYLAMGSNVPKST